MYRGADSRAAETESPAKAEADAKPRKPPQEALNDFWDGLITKTPGKVFQIFPRSLYANLLPPIGSEGAFSRERASASYQAAAEECKRKVDRIVKECRRTNEKFTDPDFDIENDWDKNCLRGLPTETSPAAPVDYGVGGEPLRNALNTLLTSKVLGENASVSMDVAALKTALGDNNDRDEDELAPATAHRIDYIFDDPSFILDGYSSSDVQQGQNGDCWWIAAVSTLCSKPELMEQVCVARDAECGVYGFVFYRDGDWISTVVDDNLYLSHKDYDATRGFYDATGEAEQKYKKTHQTGSEALYFAKCADQNETWLPLMEKAYAKVHGDYDSIQGGDSGEGVEDLTGGVSTTLMSNRILSKDKLWQELLNVNKEFIFAASSPYWATGSYARRGLANSHAYSILKAVEVAGEDDKKVRLVLVRNPWGRRDGTGVGEWTGPWSDGSKEWTPYWMKKLNHRFGDDGEFWMSYTDLCRKFETLHRTRLFNEHWFIVQQWTSIHVSYVSGYLTTKFTVEVNKAGTVVIVLSQLDSRYFEGLQGQYSFTLQFLLQEENAQAGDYLVRASGSCWFSSRSVSAEIELEPGKYEVLPKISATRSLDMPLVEDVVKKAAEENPQKLRQIGLNYDLAHAKGGFEEEEAAKKLKAEAKAQKLKDEKERKEKAEKERKEQEKVKKDGKGDDAQTEGESQKKEEEETVLPKRDKLKTEESATVKEGSDTKKASEQEKKDTESKDEAKASTEEPKKEDDEKPKESAPDTAKAKGDENTNPWNAVAVIGLRAYSKDPDLIVKLVKPKDPEQASMLDVDGVSGAGATS